MRLTTKGRYAVTAMLDLAIHAQNGPVSLNDISGRQGISLSYLEQLFAMLRRGGLVASVRGPGGGYRLSQDGEECLTHHLWLDLSDQIHAFLHGITLAQLIQRKEIRSTADRQDSSVRNRIDAVLSTDDMTG